jgi:hypothetical protein
MPSQDEIMQQIFKLVGDGAAMPLNPEIESALRDRYYGWIVKRKEGNPSSPQEIWDDKEGSGIQQKFRDIGQHMAQQKSKLLDLDGAACVNSYLTIERLSECPHCPDPLPGI